MCNLDYPILDGAKNTNTMFNDLFAGKLDLFRLNFAMLTLLP
jgi:hypothetical protein